MSTECRLKGRLYRVCNFEARYDYHPLDHSKLEIGTDQEALVEALRRKTYVRDVCTTHAAEPSSATRKRDEGE